MISKESLAENLLDELKRMEYFFPPDLERVMKEAFEREDIPFAKTHFDVNICTQISSAAENVPYCGDSGTIMYYAIIGEKMLDKLPGGFAGFTETIKEVVAKGTIEVPLRANAVDPLTGFNPNTNVGKGVPNVVYKIRPGADYVEITTAALGGGPELFQRALMMTPNDGWKGMKKFVLDSVLRVRGRNCTPHTLGIGIGGSMDQCCALAKQAAYLRLIGEAHPDEKISLKEKEILDNINEMAIGPWGLGGKTSAFDVHIETAYTHPALVCVAVYPLCPAVRRVTCRFYADGRFENKLVSSWFAERE